MALKLKVYLLAALGVILTFFSMLLKIKTLQNQALKTKIAHQNKAMELHEQSIDTALKKKAESEKRVKQYEAEINSGIDHDLH